MSDQQTGAADWRSETEKRKSLLRKSVISLFKTWIPDHPEASVARGEVFSTTRDAMNDFADSVTFVSLLSFGSEDMFAHDFLTQPLSMQDLLVQREGTDAFLDAKNALRVVRRKFGMMTLIARMASTLEQRNIVAVKLRQGFDQDELIRFSKAMTVRVEGTAAEEEIEFKRRLRKSPCEHLDIIYHSELIGRRVPVPWPVKEMYSMIGRQHKKTRNVTPEFLHDVAAANAGRLGAKVLRQLSLHADHMAEDLDAGGLNPFPVIIKAADERRMLTATRSIFDDFHEIRSLRRRERAEALVDGGEVDAPTEEDIEGVQSPNESSENSVSSEAVSIDTDDDFVAAAEDASDDDSEFLLLAQALDRIRTVLGKAFFHRISMVSGDVNFVDAAMAGEADPAEMASGQDPLAALEQAREITEPFYRARGLANAVSGLLEADYRKEAVDAAEEAIRSARGCQTEDNIAAYTCTFPALLAAECISTAADAVKEVLAKAHIIASDSTRSAALMRVVSSLMEAGPLPPKVRRALTSSILGEDVYFWGKDAVQAPLVEVILALMSGIDDDTILFLQKVVVHPNIEIRKSVLRTLPLDENDHIRNMLVSHLQDPDASVRIEVLERIGSSMDLKLASYILNHYRQDAAKTEQEKRAVALNLARIDIERHMPIFNAMLGRIATKEDRYIKRMKPRKDDIDYQRAGLEVLYHLNSREARRLLFNAAEKGSGPGKLYAERVWNLIKSKAYGEPTLPRSTHDPEYDAETAFNLDEALHAFEKERVATAPPEAVEAQGLFGKLKSRIFSRSQKPAAITPMGVDEQPQNAKEPVSMTDEPPAQPISALTGADNTLEDTSVPTLDEQQGEPSSEVEIEIPTQAAPPEPVRAGLKIEASVSADRRKWSGTLPMTFSIYGEPTGGKALWMERQTAVTITAGRFEVLLGTHAERLPGLPEKIWLSIDIDGETLEPRAEVSKYRSVVQG